jgi:hypothetical protein
LEDNEMLNDNIINAAQELARTANPQLDGMQNVLLSSKDGDESFDSQPSEGAQIHHTRQAHWNISSSLGGKVRIWDSYFSEPNIHVRRQMWLLYGDRQTNTAFEVTVMRQQQQSGGTQCGDFAIATLFELVAGVDPAQLNNVYWDQQKMRRHLKECLEQGKATPFPRLDGKAKRVVVDPGVFLVDDLGGWSARDPPKKQGAKRRREDADGDSEPDADDPNAAAPLLPTSRGGRTSKPTAKALQSHGLSATMDTFFVSQGNSKKAKTQAGGKKIDNSK